MKMPNPISYLVLCIILMVSTTLSYSFVGTSPSYNTTISIGAVSSSNSTSYLGGGGSSDNFQVILGDVGASFCIENWTYSNWSTCSSSSQTRTATDLNNCGTIFNRSTLSQTCTVINSSSITNSSSTNSTSDDNDDNDSSSTSSSSTSNTKLSSSNKNDKSKSSNSNSNKEIKKVGSQGVKKGPDKLHNKFQISIGGNTNLDTQYTGSRRVKFKDKNSDLNLVQFDHDFSSSELNLENVEIESGDHEEKPFVIVRGVELTNTTKIIQMKPSMKSNAICIKDAEIDSITEVSRSCNGKNEYLIECNTLTTSEGYKCNPNKKAYIISGLKHSAVIEVDGSLLPVKEKKEKENKVLDNESFVYQQEEISNEQVYTVMAVLLSLAILIVLVVIFTSSKKPKKKEVKEKKHRYTKKNYMEDPTFTNIKQCIDVNIYEHDKKDIIDALVDAGYEKKLVKIILKYEY